METSFANSRIRKVCSSLQTMWKELGDARAIALNRRIQQLQEAVCLEDVRSIAGDWHELTANRKGQIAGSIGQPYRLIIEPTDDPPPTPSSILGRTADSTGRGLPPLPSSRSSTTIERR